MHVNVSSCGYIEIDGYVIKSTDQIPCPIDFVVPIKMMQIANDVLDERVMDLYTVSILIPPQPARPLTDRRTCRCVEGSKVGRIGFYKVSETLVGVDRLE